MALQVALRLEGGALQVLSDLRPGECHNWPLVQEALRRHFGRRIYAEHAREQLISRQRLDSETLGSYAADILLRNQQGYPDVETLMQEKLALQAFIRGLRPLRLSWQLDERLVRATDICSRWQTFKTPASLDGLVDDIGGRNRCSSETALAKLKKVFDAIRQANLRLHPWKCHLFRRETTFLGHVISAAEVSTDPNKVSTVRDSPEPRIPWLEVLQDYDFQIIHRAGRLHGNSDAVSCRPRTIRADCRQCQRVGDCSPVDLRAVAIQAVSSNPLHPKCSQVGGETIDSVEAMGPEQLREEQNQDPVLACLRLRVEVDQRPPGRRLLN
ncbi:hypothetical protein XENOCAPTIV_009840 [Xenoophorus captivus]|uniref:Retrotransposon gag domain-containing protein n=1 Tax=Xenoophorus captivus TaxID=1517983 RepID=A0ABV0RGL7_9TELE